MSLLIETPAGNPDERNYALAVIFNEWLGIPWSLSQSDREDVCIRLSGHVGEIIFPDVFLSRAENLWLDIASLPKLPLAKWDSRELEPAAILIHPTVPVLFGDSQPGISKTINAKAPLIRLPIDIFGSVFFMLSRYEEAVVLERDEHDRFPAIASLAYRAGFLNRPIADEYIEILWAAMLHTWPWLERKQRQPRILVSCDVDIPFCFTRSLKIALRRVGGDIFKRGSLKGAVKETVGTWYAHRGVCWQDALRSGIDFIMEANERAGRSVAFYFIPENTDPLMDNSVSLDDPRMRTLLREIHARGHEIGIHPGYYTYQHPEAMRQSVETLRRVLDEEGVEQVVLGGRQHYLRWATSATARLWEGNRLDYDSTLGYADRPGFRCGTCHEYTMYDVQERRQLKLRQRPLIVMECSVIADHYLGLGYSEDALTLMLDYRDTCYRLNGDFGLLWHNSHLLRTEDKTFYVDLLG